MSEMGLTIDIRADSKFPVDRKALRAALQTAWEKQGISGDAQVSIAVVGSRKMRELTRRYLAMPEATDVLAFPLQGEGGGGYGFVGPEELPLMLGDIVLCFPLLMEEAVQRGILVDDVVVDRVLHGMRNLMGDER